MNRDALQDARAEHASTVGGRAEIEAQRAAASHGPHPDHQLIAALDSALVRGADIRARNKALADSARGAAPVRGAASMPTGALPVGSRFLYRGVETTVLAGPEHATDQFGRGMLRYTARREDTGAVGPMMFGPDGAVTAAPMTAEHQARLSGPDFDHAVATARASLPVMRQVVAKEHWCDTRIVLDERTGGLHVYPASAWEEPTSQPLLPWSPPTGRVVATIDLDGSLTRHA